MVTNYKNEIEDKSHYVMKAKVDNDLKRLQTMKLIKEREEELDAISNVSIKSKMKKFPAVIQN